MSDPRWSHVQPEMAEALAQRVAALAQRHAALLAALDALMAEMDQEHADRYFAGKLRTILDTHWEPEP